MSAFLFLSRWNRTSTARSREIVLEVLKSSHPNPLGIQAIYERIRRDYADEKVPIPDPLPGTRMGPQGMISRNKIIEAVPPPHPDHPIRSVKYLKTVVLSDLHLRNQVAKVHFTRPPTSEELQRKNERPMRKSKKKQSTVAPPVNLNSKGLVDQWGWALKTVEEQDKEKKDNIRIQKAVEGQKNLDPKRLEKEKKRKEEEEWGHLNVRRQRARAIKVVREDKWAKVLDRGREEGLAARSS